MRLIYTPSSIISSSQQSDILVTIDEPTLTVNGLWTAESMVYIRVDLDVVNSVFGQIYNDIYPLL